MHRRFKPMVPVMAVMAFSLGRVGSAGAEEPIFSFAAPENAAGDATESADDVKWNASAHAGVNVTSGNAAGLSLSGGGKLSRRAGDDRLSVDASGSFARTRVQNAADTNGVAGIGPDEVRAVVQTTSAAWVGKLRYDRFLGAHHSVYAAATASADEPAGRRLAGGLQVGYSRDVLRAPGHSLTLEAGYDVTYQDYVAVEGSTTLHSARLSAVYEWNAAPSANASFGAELLTNVAGVDTPTGYVSPLEDDRLTARAEFSLKVNEHGRIATRVLARYDSHPAPKPAPAGLTWEPDYLPVADRFDTQTEIVFIYSFL